MQTILLIGTGPMAIEYTKVLKAMNKEFSVIGRGSKSAELFKKQTGIIPELGGLDVYLKGKKLNKNTLAIIATGTETLMSITHQLLKSGVEKILVENIRKNNGL